MLILPNILQILRLHCLHNLPIKSWINFQDFNYEDEEEKKTKKKNKWKREERRHKKL
jgi:hypothetical protein